jgi:hypothetical protein
MNRRLTELQDVETEWSKLTPPSKWQEYHQAHKEYIQLDIEAYRLALEGLTELDERKLLEAEAAFQALQAKRDEIARLLSELGAL